MEIINKTFELQLQDTSVKGIVTSLTDDEIDEIKNLGKENYSGVVFKVLVLTAPELGAHYFDPPSLRTYVIGYEGKEGQLGLIESDEFIPYEGNNFIIRKIATSILDVLVLNGKTGHFLLD